MWVKTITERRRRKKVHKILTTLNCTHKKVFNNSYENTLKCEEASEFDFQFHSFRKWQKEEEEEENGSQIDW